MKIAGSGSESGSISQRRGSAETDPDPHQNVMDLQHLLVKYMLLPPRVLRISRSSSEGFRRLQEKASRKIQFFMCAAM
jgi:hypothetical protein